MTVTATETVRDIVTDALLDIGVSVIGQAVSADDMALGIRHLNRIMKAWNSLGFAKYLSSSQQITLTTSASYTLSPARPSKITTARFVRSGIETPMIELTRAEYDELPNKAATGQPTQFYYDRKAETATFYVWPTLATAAGEVINLSVEREIEDISSENDTIDIPAEWYDAAVRSLAARLVFPYDISDQRGMVLNAAAKDALDTAIASDTEFSVFWGGENA